MGKRRYSFFSIMYIPQSLDTALFLKSQRWYSKDFFLSPSLPPFLPPSLSSSICGYKPIHPHTQPIQSSVKTNTSYDFDCRTLRTIDSQILPSLRLKTFLDWGEQICEGTKRTAVTLISNL